jgi:2',3'-cyclic-nucleotide 2'-phosphodiesterase (5'-nucleotidase family)
VSLTSGGGLRADIPSGALTYGQLFAANPFDNRFAIVKLTGRDLKRLAGNNLGSGSGVFSFGGVQVNATCKAGTLAIDIRRKGKSIKDDDKLTLVTSDFLASGGDGAIGRLKLPDGSVELTNIIIRDAMADVLRKQGGKLDAGKLYDKDRPRLVYPGKRPVKCGSSPKAPPPEPD